MIMMTMGVFTAEDPSNYQHFGRGFGIQGLRFSNAISKAVGVFQF